MKLYNNNYSSKCNQIANSQVKKEARNPLKIANHLYQRPTFKFTMKHNANNFKIKCDNYNHKFNQPKWNYSYKKTVTNLNY